MASPNTIKLQRDNALRRMLAFKVLPETHAGGNRDARRRQIRNWCNTFNVPYTAAREQIKEAEVQMRAAGIDPWAPGVAEKLKAYEKEHGKPLI